VAGDSDLREKRLKHCKGGVPRPHPAFFSAPRLWPRITKKLLPAFSAMNAEEAQEKMRVSFLPQLQ